MNLVSFFKKANYYEERPYLCYMFCDFPEASSRDHCVFQEKFRMHSSCVTRDPWEQRLNHEEWFCAVHVRGES